MSNIHRWNYFRGGASSRTAALQALLRAFDDGGREGVAKKAIFFSDMQPVIRQDCMGDLLATVKESGIELFVVGSRGLLGAKDQQSMALNCSYIPSIAISYTYLCIRENITIILARHHLVKAL